MDYIKRIPGRVSHALSTDITINRTIRYGGKTARAAPSAAVQYLVERVPVVHWLPKYSPRWLLNDTLAGITVGVLLIPQSLAYAKIATIPGEYGLMSSWLPNFLVFIMGTSKDLSTGPTSLMGLLTAEIVADVVKEGYTAQAIASAVAMSVGIYSLAIGLLKLGFLLEFISVPVLSGFISAAAIVIMLGQIPSLFGITVRSGTANIIHDIFAKIPQWDGATTGIGLGGILILVLMQKMGQRWGKQSKAVWLLALGRSAVVLILFTGLSYGLNKNRADDPVWALSKVKSNGITSPKMPDTQLIQTVFPRAIAPFIAAALEHLAIAKAFGRKNDYVTDPAQELVYLGTTNFFNSFFSSMAVGGAMSRTAVNSDSGVKSPAYGIIAGGVVILSIFKLSPALFWIPKATLAAIIVTAVWHIVIPPSVFYGYWKTSLVDFTAAMLAFWLTLFQSSEIGIGTAVGFSIAYHLLFAAFHRARRLTCLPAAPATHKTQVPLDTQLFALHQPLLFPNAYSLKSQITDSLATFSSPAPVSPTAHADRNWSVAASHRATLLRRRANIDPDDEPVPLRTLILDLTGVWNVDTTGLTALRDLVADVHKFGGRGAEVRFVGLNERVKLRFARFGWPVKEVGGEGDGGVEAPEGSMGVFRTVGEALEWRRGSGEFGAEEVFVVGDEKGVV
ncbi:sulfate permease-like protein [Boeremia exigua]|uniref:sulfate permease-like protein n=1 Tax=Boeremia exigua TaxID=749465 RepID=UPI001E8CF042|nr:sulfate permease-like protein [Boeremia exigua]KAH6613829.1 sulfate permease-like protein [Boeremia exigua]